MATPHKKTAEKILSEAQGRALEKLMVLYESDSSHPCATARMIKGSLPTLQALCGMGFAEPWVLGGGLCPRDYTYWRITKAGAAVVKLMRAKGASDDIRSIQPNNLA